jgi:hypothetical protein
MPSRFSPRGNTSKRLILLGKNKFRRKGHHGKTRCRRVAICAEKKILASDFAKKKTVNNPVNKSGCNGKLKQLQRQDLNL